MTKEEWKDIKGYEGLYQVSNEGRVRSLDRTRTIKSRWGTYSVWKFPGRIMTPCNDKDGYRLVTLTKPSQKGVSKRVHILMAEAFIANPEGKTQIDHIIPISDGGTDEVSNLRWVTPKENSNNQISLEKNRSRPRLSGEKHPFYDKKRPEHAKKLSIPIVEIKEDGSVVEWESTKICAEKCGHSAPRLTLAVNGKNRKKGHYYKTSQFYKKEEYKKMLEDLASQQLN